MKHESMEQFFLNMSAAAMSQAAAIEHLAAAFSAEYGNVDVTPAAARVETATTTKRVASDKPNAPAAPKAETKPAAKPASKPATKPAAKAATKPAAKTAAKPASDDVTMADQAKAALMAVNRDSDRSTSKTVMESIGDAGVKFDDIADDDIYAQILEAANAKVEELTVPF